MTRRHLLIVPVLIFCLSACVYEYKKSKDTTNPLSENYVNPSMTPYLDEAHDFALDAYLDSLSETKDTTTLDVDVTKEGRPFKVAFYSEIRNATGEEKGLAGKSISKYFNDILPFSGKEKLYFDLMAGLAKEALYLSDRKNFVYGDSGINKPAQIGLAYSWGSKNFALRQNPPGYGDNCGYQIFGLDCSGFIYQIFLRNNIFLPPGRALDQCKVSTMTKALTPYFHNASDFLVSDLGKIAVSDIATGDIVYFKNKNQEIVHIGICLKNLQGRLSFFESSGSPNQCAGNINDRKGVRGLQLNSRLGADGRDYSIVRITLK